MRDPNMMSFGVIGFIFYTIYTCFMIVFFYKSWGIDRRVDALGVMMMVMAASTIWLFYNLIMNTY